MKAKLGNYILTGAGFSKNWGGWLSQELWNFLIGHAEVQQDEELKELLWNNIHNGFEHALFEAKERAKNNAEWEKRYNTLQKVISQAFKEMNSLFGKSKIFPKDQGEYDVQDFLKKFDVIFTTNQDVLVEARFMKLKFFIPGMGAKLLQSVIEVQNIRHQEQIRYPNEESLSSDIRANSISGVPYIKLHGSSNWFTSQGGDELMILGGEKAAQIAGNTLIKSYFDILREKLSKPESRLLILGHSLLDSHINKIIFEAIRIYGLKFYIWNNSGFKGLMKNLEKDPNYDEQLFKQGLIGVSTVSLQHILKEDSIREFELARIKREFFGKT